MKEIDTIMNSNVILIDLGVSNDHVGLLGVHEISTKGEQVLH